MIPQLTKEILLERVLALDDGAIIDGSLKEILMTTSNSPAMIDTIKAAHRIVGKPEEKSIGHFMYAGEETSVKNDLVTKYISTRKNVTNINHVGFGIVPDDLEHPIEEDGAGWRIRTAKKGGFCFCTYCWGVRGTNEDELFAEIDRVIADREWIHTYIYSIVEGNSIEGHYASAHVVRNLMVRMDGITQVQLDDMKTRNPEEEISIAEYMCLPDRGHFV